MRDDNVKRTQSEVRVPPAERDDPVPEPGAIDASRGQDDERLEAMCQEAIRRYGVRVLDNIDPSRLPDVRQRARVIARALMEKGGLSGFRFGRQLLKVAGAPDDLERPAKADHADAGSEPI